MKATARTLFVLLLGSGFAGSALAAMDSAQTTPDTQVPAHMSQKLHDDLTKAGFTDITIMPASLLVRAKDSQGNSVMMLINSDSLTEATQHTQGTNQPKTRRSQARSRANRTARSPRPRRSNRRPRGGARLCAPVDRVGALLEGAGEFAERGVEH